jgi:hypothetical protein
VKKPSDLSVQEPTKFELDPVPNIAFIECAKFAGTVIAEELNALPTRVRVPPPIGKDYLRGGRRSLLWVPAAIVVHLTLA